MIQLTVEKAKPEDARKDTARIHQEFRKDVRGRKIPSGEICRLSARGKSKLVILRGLEGQTTEVITLDNYARERLGVKVGETISIRIERATWLGKIRWACTTDEVGYRISAWLGVTSIVLGLIGLALGILSLVR